MDRRIGREETLPLVKMSKDHLGRTTSVVTDPQLSALQAIKEANNQLLCDLLTDDSVGLDVNHVYQEEGGKTLLHIAADQNDVEATRLLASSGANGNVVSTGTRSVPLHIAARKGNVAILQILLSAKAKADINATTADGKTVLHILAKKCGKSSPNYTSYLECLKLTLRQPGVDVDHREKSASLTPLYIAAKEAESREAVEMLLKANADISATCDGENMRELLNDTFGNGILDSQPGLDDAMMNDSGGGSNAARSKLLQLMHEAVVRDTRQDFEDELNMLAISPVDVNVAPTNQMNLIQVSCDEGLPYHLELLLKVPGVDVNSFSIGKAPGLILAAQSADVEVMKVLFAHEGLDVSVRHEGSSVLHTVLRKPLINKNYERCLDVVLDKSPKKMLKEVINRKDTLGNTALHYATQMWPQTTSRRLLELGANIGLQNVYEEVPISRILPETFESFLDEHCLTSEGNVTNENFRITAKFDFLVPFGTLDDDEGKQKTVEDGGGDVKNDDIDYVPLPETEGLWYMSQSKKHQHLLKHPVIAAFLWMKWKRVGAAYNRNLLFYFAFVACLTGYIFTLFSGRALRSDGILIESCGSVSVRADVTVLWHLVTVLLVGLVLREALQLGIAPRRYFFSLENWLEMVLIALTSVLLFYGHYGCHVQTKRHLGAAIIVLSWSELITMVGRHPKLTTYNIYVTMFYKVLGTFILFLMWYSLFIIAFALGFYVLLHNDSDQEPGDYVFFDDLGLCVVKTFTMFVGELEFGDLPVHTGFGYIFLLAFVFLIVVVMMNLLNGLAVSDTGVIRAEAEIHAYKCQVEIISYIESTVLGDPFNFLANWPSFVWLRRIPTCSIVGGGRLYKVPPVRDAFHRLTGAKNIMLFQGGSGDSSVTFFPNREDGGSLKWCCATDDEDKAAYGDFPEYVVEAAKEVALATRKRNEEESEVDRIEQRLGHIEAMLRNLTANMAK